MSIKDKEKWDQKYKSTPELLENRSVSKKLISISDKIEGNIALDIACGSGRNSIYLAKLGFKVDALDISDIAIESLTKKALKNISAKVIDLENYIPTKNSYDLIVMTNYLDREIIPYLSNALKKDGVLFIETYMDHPSNTKSNSNPSFLLQKNELKSFFDKSYEILLYEEFDNEAYELFSMKKQVIAVKKLS